MKKVSLIFITATILLLTGCASEEDKSIAQLTMSQIESIETVTLNNAEEIYNIIMSYEGLTDKQKKLVKNYQELNDSIKQLEELLLEEEIKNDPTNTITENEIQGIWKADTADTHRGYLLFDDNGYLYYMASKTTVTQSSFTSDYLISTSFKLKEYNKNTREKEGSFYCIPIGADSKYSVTKDESGNLKMRVEGSTMGGTYTKTGEKIDTTPEQCLHSGCINKSVTTGDSRYCEIHSNKCIECGDYIDEDALFCVNCIVEALRTIK